MAKYLIDSTDIEIENVSGTDNLKFNFANGNSIMSNFQLVNATGTASGNIVDILIPFPTGFTESNTFVIDGQMCLNNANYKNQLPMIYVDINTGAVTGRTSISIDNTGIDLYCEGAVFAGSTVECWLLLMKYE